jgi:hypothetical protein
MRGGTPPELAGENAPATGLPRLGKNRFKVHRSKARE